jgi:sulfonate transport system permease protein
MSETLKQEYQTDISNRFKWLNLQGNSAIKKFAGLVIPFIFPLVLLGLWQLASDKGWVAEQILPAPLVVYQSFLDLIDSGQLQEHLIGSLTRVGIAFSIASILGVTLGIFLGISRRAEAYIAPLFEVYAQTPVIAWIPIGLLLFGITEKLAVALIAIAAIVPIIMNTYKGVRYISKNYLEIGRIYAFTRRQTIFKIVIPAALPSIFNGLRYGLTQAWLTLVAAELVGIDRGIGAMIVEARNLFQLDIVIVAIITLGIVGLALDKLFVLAERRLLHWQRQGL